MSELLSKLQGLIAARRVAGRVVVGGDVVRIETVKVGPKQTPQTVIRFVDGVHKPFGSGAGRIVAVAPHLDAAIAFTTDHEGLTVQEFTNGQLRVIKANMDAALTACEKILEASTK